MAYAAYLLSLSSTSNVHHVAEAAGLHLFELIEPAELTSLN